MRKPPAAKVALSTACPGCSVPPASTTPVMMMVPGPDRAVDATWKYSVRADCAGAHERGANPAHPVPGDQGPAFIEDAAGVASAPGRPGPHETGADPVHPGPEDQKPSLIESAVGVALAV